MARERTALEKGVKWGWTPVVGKMGYMWVPNARLAREAQAHERTYFVNLWKSPKSDKQYPPIHMSS